MQAGIAAALIVASIPGAGLGSLGTGPSKAKTTLLGPRFLKDNLPTIVDPEPPSSGSDAIANPTGVEPDEEKISLGASGTSVVIASAVLAAGVLILGTGAWWDGGLTGFSLRDTGGLGRDTYAGGGDKMGHLYSSYVSMHMVEPLYVSLGVPKRQAPWWAAGFTTLMWNGFELVDGFTEFGFEYGDVIFNTVGIGLGLITRLYPEVHETVGMRLAYVPSSDFLDNDATFVKFINDYSGMQFYFDLKLDGFYRHVLGKDPGWAKYVLVGLVHGTNHYGPIRRHNQRARHIGVHAGLSFAQVLRAFGDGDTGVDGVANVFEYYAVPFMSVALMKDINGGPWFVNFGLANRFDASL